MAITMEELERKAKRYDEVLAMAQECVTYIPDEAVKKYMLNMFPELKESRDEEIRKLLIKLFKSNTNEKFYDVSTQEIVAWLEKQGNADNIEPKIEPKFHKGEWVVWQDKCYKVNFNGCGYELIDQNGLSTSLEYETVDENAHLWTILDAKDGDVLYSLDSKQPFIFKHRKPNEQAEVYCGINIYGKFFVENTKDCIITTDKYIPATKEQRDTLFAKMREAGYKWDAEKKELKKIEQKHYLLSDFFDPEHEFEKTREMNSTKWGEEDDYNLQCMIAKAVSDIQNGYIGRNQELIDWLKSLKDRVGCEANFTTTKEWSEEDEHRAKDTIYFLDTAKKHYASTVELDACIDWLKSLKQRIGG